MADDSPHEPDNSLDSWLEQVAAETEGLLSSPPGAVDESMWREIIRTHMTLLDGNRLRVAQRDRENEILREQVSMMSTTIKTYEASIATMTALKVEKDNLISLWTQYAALLKRFVPPDIA